MVFLFQKPNQRPPLYQHSNPLQRSIGLLSLDLWRSEPEKSKRLPNDGVFQGKLLGTSLRIFFFFPRLILESRIYWWMGCALNSCSAQVWHFLEKELRFRYRNFRVSFLAVVFLWKLAWIELKSLGLSRNWIIDRAIWHIKRETKWWLLRSANPDIQFSVYFLWFLSLFCLLDESNSDIYEPPIGLLNFSAKIQHRTEWSRQRKLNTHEWCKNSILTSSTEFKFVWWWFINWFHYFFQFLQQLVLQVLRFIQKVKLPTLKLIAGNFCSKFLKFHYKNIILWF